MDNEIEESLFGKSSQVETKVLIKRKKIKNSIYIYIYLSNSYFFNY